MFSARDILIQRLGSFNSKISENLDFNFSAVSRNINTFDDFERELLSDFYSGKQIFYRGERINSRDRNLLPTMLRNTQALFSESDLGIVHIDADFLFNYYSSLGSFVTVFNNTMGKADGEHLYEICAFAQHYYHMSPLIDFTKSIYPALSFALKDRTEFNDDIILYTVELKNKEDYTTDILTADSWLHNMSVYVSRFDEDDVKTAVKELVNNKGIIMNEDFRQHIERLATPPTPTAKLIDVPTNTRMKFQQGVFLMLTDFQLFNVKYFTKNIREHFTFNKFVINKDLCPALVKLINDKAPWYLYKYLTDVEAAFKTAVEEK